MGGGYFTACGNDDSSSDSNGYSVGSTVSFGGSLYYVVSNTIGSSTNRSASRAAEQVTTESASDDAVAELAQTLSVENAKKYATQYFGENILLIRTAGSVSVPYGKKDEYVDAYTAVTANLLENEKESDYFKEISNETKNEVDYTDKYLILDANEDQIGTCDVNWNSDLNKTFADDKTLFDLIKDFSPNLIRAAVAGQYQISKYDKKLKSSYNVMDNKLEENGNYRILESAPNALYVVGNKKIRQAVALANEWNAEGQWVRAYLSPCAIYGDSTVTAGITYTVRYEKNAYTYQIAGSSKITEGKYDTKKVSFTFGEDGTYTTENHVIPTDANIYASNATLKYDNATLSVPIEFIKNADGSVSFGPTVYAWVEHWRDYIVSTHNDAEVYTEAE